MSNIILFVDNPESEESLKLKQEATKLFTLTTIISKYNNVGIILEKGKKAKIIINDGVEPEYDYAVMRNTNKSHVAKCVLMHALYYNSTDIVDPLSRYAIGFSSKLLSTIERHSKGLTADTFISFSHQTTLRILKYLKETNPQYKFFVKPIDGTRNEGTVTINSYEELQAFSTTFHYSDSSPLYFQKFINIKNEYRILLVNGKTIAYMKKKRAPDGTISYVKLNGCKMRRFAEAIDTRGILGIDACEDDNGNFYIIETNRSPMFRALEKHSRINIAEHMLSEIKHAR